MPICNYIFDICILYSIYVFHIFTHTHRQHIDIFIYTTCICIFDICTVWCMYSNVYCVDLQITSAAFFIGSPSVKPSWSPFWLEESTIKISSGRMRRSHGNPRSKNGNPQESTGILAKLAIFATDATGKSGRNSRLRQLHLSKETGQIWGDPRSLKT